MLALLCCAQAFSSCGKWGYSLLWCKGFSLWWLPLLQSTGSRHAGFSSCGSWALECRCSSCGTGALLLLSMCNLPRPGLKPMSPALTGRFLTTAPPGESQVMLLKTMICRLGHKTTTICWFTSHIYNEVTKKV